jgi:hypothetical protein
MAVQLEASRPNRLPSKKPLTLVVGSVEANLDAMTAMRVSLFWSIS